MLKKRFIAIVALLLIPLIGSLAWFGSREPARFLEEQLPSLPDPIDRDLGAIQQRDTLVALTTTNSTSYFVYRGMALGFEFELLEAFAEDQGLALRMVVTDPDSLLPMLLRGEGDIAAGRLAPMDIDTARVAFTNALYDTRPVLVQRKPGAEGQPDPSADGAIGPAQDLPERIEVRARLIENAAQLTGEDVYVSQLSPYEDYLVELSESLSGDIIVVQVDSSSEALIQEVSTGVIDFAVAQENVAQLNQAAFTNIAARPTLGPSHAVSWAVRANAPSLLGTLNGWIEEERGSARFNQFYQRYFVDRRGYRERAESDYLTSQTGTLSDYDDLLRRNAAKIGWDWRLLAAQTYQESKFEPRARSWAGAAGLLQLMPPTAREFGVRDAYDPEDNVAGAVRFIQWLTNYWDDIIEDPIERQKFIIASYNTGHGHVEDARRLTAKYGGNNKVWDDVAVWLLKKSEAKYYRDPVVKYGFARGLEPVEYVRKILDRYEHYRQFVVDPLESQAAPPTAATATS